MSFARTGPEGRPRVARRLLFQPTDVFFVEFSEKKVDERFVSVAELQDAEPFHAVFRGERLGGFLRFPFIACLLYTSPSPRDA